MAIQSQPSRISEPFAGSGTKNTIPAANATPSASQAASWASGFPPECSQPISAGGCPVPRNDMNGVLNWLSQDFAFRQDGGVWAWSALADYDVHRLVRGSDGNFYVSVAQSGPGLGAGAQDPTTDATKTYWKSFADLYVDLVSNQDIAGIKTFLNESVWRSANNARQVMATSALSKGGALPANRQGVANVQFDDANGKLFGQIECYVDATGTHLGFIAYPFNDPDNYAEAVSNLLRVSLYHNGTKSAYTFTPPANSAADEIVTASWVISYVTSDGIKGFMGRMSKPSGQTIGLTDPGAQNTFTSPGTGYIVAQATATANNAFVYLTSNQLNVRGNAQNTGQIHIYLPVVLNATVYIDYANISWQGLYFVYDIGHAPA